MLVDHARHEHISYSSKNFSLSLLDRLNIVGSDHAKDIAGFGYPVRWYNQDDTDYVDLANAADVRNFFLAALGTYRALSDSGNSLKEAVTAATTKAALDAVVDTR